MKRVTFIIVLTLALVATTANAQATRTWVSGVGDDVNPCSRTAPCKTFAGAISKTAAGGEINALDPGGFGTVTITKSITIDGGPTYQAGILSSGGINAININDSFTATPGTIRVILRNLSINGAGTGLNGINFISGKALTVENVQIWGVTNRGINYTASVVDGSVSIRNTTIAQTNAEGISIRPGVAGNAFVTLDRVQVSLANNNAVHAGARTKMSIQESNLSNNRGGAGLSAEDATTFVSIARSILSNNATGINAGTVGQPIIRLNGNSITGNTNGLLISAGASVTGVQNNQIADNGGNQALTASGPGQ